jgi:hypothetical protein
MYILFAISVLCFFALVLTVVAIVSQVRTHRTHTAPQHDFAQHLFATIEDQHSRTSISPKRL